MLFNQLAEGGFSAIVASFNPSIEWISASKLRLLAATAHVKRWTPVPVMRDNQIFLPRSLAMEMTAVLTPAEEGGYVALNPETGTTTQGETVEEAIANLTEATALYLSEFPLPAPGHPLVTMFSIPARA